jgi:hypothetical protein
MRFVKKATPPGKTKQMLPNFQILNLNWEHELPVRKSKNYEIN